ncbi:MAG: glycosyltransferase family 4 protein [Candidatus Methanospirare jalkutatii]|nr:glycosyltransferase family 4 protein [Candidatus Methanospirare jalkutatii]
MLIILKMDKKVINKGMRREKDGISRYKIVGLGRLTGFSGVHEHLWPSIAKKHELVEVVDTRLSGFWKYWNIAYCFWKLPGFSKYIHPIRTILGKEISDYRQRTLYYIFKRTEAFEKKIEYLYDKCDLFLQTGWLPAIRSKPKKPRFIFVDFTMKLAEREYPPWAIFFSERDKRRWLELEAISYRNATIVFTSSDYVRNSIIKDYEVDEEKVVTVYEGANLEELPIFAKEYDKKLILFVGREFNRKGGPTLIKAFKEVKKEIKDAKMIIVGSLPLVKDENIIVKGYISRDELLRLYENASIFAMPSICEPFGLVFLEAMAYKTPCIGTTVDAMPEIIENGKTGFLVPPNDHKELADKLILLLEDENLMKRMGESGRRRVEKYFTWDIVVDRMTKEFEKYL